jgi:hypothetical protein
VDNYFNYFTEIEEHFQRRRGGILLLSTLDWALIETWKDAGIPLEAALRGIDAAFDKYDQRPSKSRKVNSVAYCAQEVLASAEEMKEAAVGAPRTEAKRDDSGLQRTEIAVFLRRNAKTLGEAKLPERSGVQAETVAREIASTLRGLADGLEANSTATRLEDLELRLTIMEEKIFSVLLATTADDDMFAVRAEADRELAPYRRKISGPQIVQLQKQFVNKRLLDKYKLPRLSLFYM